MEDYTKWLIKDYKHWKVYLHSEYYTNLIGTVYLWSKTKGDIDIIDMSQEQRDEFFEIGKNVKEALKELFAPDRFNYTQMGNNSPHLHVHMIPRYKESRTFENFTFIDETWGWIPKEKSETKVPEEVLLKVKEAIFKKLEEVEYRN